MSLTLMSPKSSSTLVARTMASRLTELEGLRIGLLSNGKLNADLLLEQTAALFVAHDRCVVAPLLTKPFASKPAEAAMLQQLAEQADFIITANGD